MVHISAKAFDRVVQRVIEELPDPFAQVLERVPVIVDLYPSEELPEAADDDGSLLGLFVGPPIEEWERTDAPPEAAVIYLFQRNLELGSRTQKELHEQIRVTLLHELGHCLGFDEDGLHRIGLG